MVKFNCDEQHSRTHQSPLKNLAIALITVFSVSACDSGSSGLTNIIAESDWAAQDGTTIDSTGNGEETPNTVSNGNTETSSSGSTTTNPSNNTGTSGSSGSTSTPSFGAASSATALPYIDFKAPAVNLPSSTPALRTEVKISAAGTVVKRISDYAEFASGKMPHFNAVNDQQLSFAYSRHHPYSKDNTYILGNAGWRWRALWKADGTYLREVTQAGNGTAVWSNTENDYIYMIDTDSRSYGKTNVLTDERTIFRTFPYDITIGDAEGDISDDDKRVAFSSNNNGYVRITAYDLETDSYNDMTLDRTYSDFDWVSVSRSGKYILVAYDKGVREVNLYNWDLSFVRRITNQKHGDIGWDENGDECWFSIGHLEPNLSRTSVAKWRLSDNAFTEILGGPGRFENRPDSLSGHISARASDRNPGQIHVSLLDAEGPYTLFSLKTDGSEQIQFYGWHGTEDANYYDEPHFTTNRTGDVGVFKSNWGNADDATEMYLIYKDPDT